MFDGVSVFTLFKELIGHPNLSDRLKLSDQVLITKDNVVILSIQVSDSDLIITCWYDPKVLYTVTAERDLFNSEKSSEVWFCCL